MNHNSCIRLLFGGQTIAAGILAPPVLANGFRRVIQPIAIREQVDKFDGAEEFPRIRFRLVERPQHPRANEYGAIILRRIQQLRRLLRRRTADGLLTAVKSPDGVAAM